MSSPSWDFPSPSANPGLDDDDEREQIEALERELLEQLERDNGAPAQDHVEALDRLHREEQQEREQIEALERAQVDALEREHREEEQEREQIEELEREQLAQMAQMGSLAAADRESADVEAAGFDAAGFDAARFDAARFDAARFDAAEQAERDELEELERESLRQLEQLERQQNSSAAAAAAAPPPPPPAPRPRTDAPTRDAPATPVVETRPGPDAKARAAQFLAEANARQALEEATRGGPPAASTELRDADERSRAARTIVEHRHQNLVEANALLTEARRVLAPIAYRGLSDRTYLRRKIILGIGEAVSLAVAFSAAFDVAPLEGLLLSGAIALAFVIAGDLGGVLRIVAERSRLSAALEDDAVHLDPRYHHILYHARQPWLSMIGGGTAAVFALATVSVGVLRAANQGSVGLAAGLGLLTVSLAIAAGLSSWQHASIGSEIIDHLQREEEAAARRLKRAASNRALRRPQIMTAVSSQEYDLPSRAPDLDWSAPDVDWQAAPTAELPALRPERGGRSRRAGRERPARAKRERASGSLVGAAAARGAVFLATLPGKLRRAEDSGPSPSPTRESKKVSKRESKIEDMSVSGDGPGALGESAGPIEAVAFRPPIQSPKKFG